MQLSSEHRDPWTRTRASELASPLALAPYYEQRVCSRRWVVHRMGEPADYWYCVISGVVRRDYRCADGRRQIVDLVLANEWFGPGSQPCHSFTAEVIEPGTILARYSWTDLAAIFERYPAERLRLLDILIRSSERLERRLLVLGRMDALRRVALFLLELVDACPPGRSYIRIPISREDIAAYLSISVESVSRALTHWRERGAIAFTTPRRIRILDPVLLEATSRRRSR